MKLKIHASTVIVSLNYLERAKCLNASSSFLCGVQAGVPKRKGHPQMHGNSDLTESSGHIQLLHQQLSSYASSSVALLSFPTGILVSSVLLSFPVFYDVFTSWLFF